MLAPHDGALDIGEALAREFFDEVAVSHSLGSDFFAAHESVMALNGPANLAQSCPLGAADRTSFDLLSPSADDAKPASAALNNGLRCSL